MDVSRRAWWAWLGRHNYGLLLASLMVVYALHPFLRTRALVVVLQVATAFLVIAALFAVKDRKVLFWLGIVLGVASYACDVYHRFLRTDSSGMLPSLVDVAFLTVIIVAITGGVIRSPRVTMNAVFGVCSIYLLLGLAWANVYQSIESVAPGSFKRPEVTATGGSAAMLENDLLYFSLITMTTVGYGDITPASPPTRTLSAVQGVTGQLFLAIFLARIVSMELGDRMARRRGPDPPEGG